MTPTGRRVIMITAMACTAIIGAKLVQDPELIDQLLSIHQEPLAPGPEQPASSQDDLMLPAAVKPPKLAAHDQTLLSESARNAMLDIQRRFTAGDYGACVALAEKYLAQDQLGTAFHAWLRQQLPIILASAGWLKLRLNHCEEAIPLFERAEQISRSQEALKGLAYCHYRKKDIRTALAYFPLYLEKNPEDLLLKLLYADALESDERYGKALRVLEEVQAAGPVPGLTPEDLNTRIKAMKARANENLLQSRAYSNLFVLTYRIGEHDLLVPAVLDTLELAVDEFIDRYGFREPQSRIEVILYSSTNFAAVNPHGPAWAQGLYDGRIRIPVPPSLRGRDLPRTLKRTLRHELVHAMLSLMTHNGIIPTWLNEGLAQRLECGRTSCGHFEFPAMPGEFLDQQSFESSYLTLNGLAAKRAYQQSLYLISTLEKGLGLSEPLRELISGLTTARSFTSDGILRQAGTDFKTLHRRAADYWRQRQTW